MNHTAISVTSITAEAPQNLHAIGVQPTSLQSWWIRQQVRWWNLLGQAAQTEAVYASAVSRWPLWGDGVEGLAFSMASAGRTSEAISLLQILLSRESGRANAWFNLGFLLQQQNGWSGSPDSNAAESALRRATEIDPQHDRAWYGLALELVAQGRQAEAVPCLKACTRIQPMSPYAWYQLGRTYHDLGEDKKARDVLAHLKTFDPKVSGQLQRELQQARTAKAE
jgi:tetratricopeptide (TPR) repeat protein